MQAKKVENWLQAGMTLLDRPLKAEIKQRGLRNLSRQTDRDRKTIRKILNGEKVKASTLAQVVVLLREE